VVELRWRVLGFWVSPWGRLPSPLSFLFCSTCVYEYIEIFDIFMAALGIY